MRLKFSALKYFVGFGLVMNIGCGTNPESTRKLTPPITVTSVKILFGGMYGYAEDENKVAKLTINPATDSSSCPVGYTATQIFGALKLNAEQKQEVFDHSVFLCTKEAASGDAPLLIYGGMWGSGYQDGKKVTFLNAFSGNIEGCPENFTDTKILGVNNVDWDLHFCSQKSSPALEFYQSFSGAFGSYSLDGTTLWYNNPVTTTPICPTNTKATKVFGTSGVDWTMYQCVPSY
ncbi:MAG: hypothetical protein J0L93_01790 [Deltaproteobacteria bacterium]|nr:hypothetical protein [Deltaproteobacteria bacterium]